MNKTYLLKTLILFLYITFVATSLVDAKNNPEKYSSRTTIQSNETFSEENLLTTIVHGSANEDQNLTLTAPEGTVFK